MKNVGFWGSVISTVITIAYIALKVITDQEEKIN